MNYDVTEGTVKVKWLLPILITIASVFVGVVIGYAKFSSDIAVRFTIIDNKLDTITALNKLHLQRDWMFVDQLVWANELRSANTNLSVPTPKLNNNPP